MRTYIVIPDGTTVLRVEASTPHYAVSKARNGKAVVIDGSIVAVPESAMVPPKEGPVVVKGQMTIEDLV